MILRTKLVLLLALFLAGAVDCLFALVALWLGWDTGALSGAFFAVFLAVFCVASVGGVTPMVYLDAAQDVELGKVDVEERRAALDRHAAPPHATREEPPGAREDDERPDLDLRWLAACHRFLVAADRHGWQIRRLVGLGIVEWDGWTDITNVLRDAGVVVKTSRTGWADGWSMEAWQEKKHSLVLPYPKDTEPPTVVIVTTTMLQQANNTRPEVVEGVRAD